MVEHVQSGDETMAPEDSACYTYRNWMLNWMLLCVFKSDEFEYKFKEPHVQVRVSPEYEFHNLQKKS